MHQTLRRLSRPRERRSRKLQREAGAGRFVPARMQHRLQRFWLHDVCKGSKWLFQRAYSRQMCEALRRICAACQRNCWKLHRIVASGRVVPAHLQHRLQHFWLHDVCKGSERLFQRALAYVLF